MHINTYRGSNNSKRVSSLWNSDSWWMVGFAKDRLLRSIITNPNHVLWAQVPPAVISKYGLRPRPHNLVMPDKDDRNFISRALYKNSTKNNITITYKFISHFSFILYALCSIDAFCHCIFKYMLMVKCPFSSTRKHNLQVQTETKLRGLHRYVK